MDPRLALSLACSCAEAYAFVRVVRARASFPFFLLYLTMTGVEPVIFLFGSPDTRAYASAWRIATAFVIAARVLIVCELWRRIMGQLDGIASISRYLFGVIVGMSIAFGFVFGFDGLSNAFGISRTGSFAILRFINRYEATVLCSVCGLLCLWIEFFKVSRNLTLHARLLGGYFLTQTVAMLAVFAWPHSAETISTASVGSVAGLYVLWGVLLTPVGEKEYVPLVSSPIKADMGSLISLMRRTLDKSERQA